jgi:hypothetical protein
MWPMSERDGMPISGDDVPNMTRIEGEDGTGWWVQRQLDSTAVSGIQTTRCVRCGDNLQDVEMALTCRAAPDRGPHEGIDGPPEYDVNIHGVRRGSSLHIADCPLSDPSPWAIGAPCFCREPQLDGSAIIGGHLAALEATELRLETAAEDAGLAHWRDLDDGALIEAATAHGWIEPQLDGRAGSGDDVDAALARAARERASYGPGETPHPDSPVHDLLILAAEIERLRQ